MPLPDTPRWAKTFRAYLTRFHTRPVNFPGSANRTADPELFLSSMRPRPRCDKLSRMNRRTFLSSMAALPMLSSLQPPQAPRLPRSEAD